MIEIPEAAVLSRQIQESCRGKKIQFAAANASPHKMAWYAGDPDQYSRMLTGKSIQGAVPRGGMVEVDLQDIRLLFADGVTLHYHDPSESIPAKHKLLVKLEDGSALTAAVQMYGGIWCFTPGSFHNEYYEKAVTATSPLEQGFTPDYFLCIKKQHESKSLSAKAFLATEQRIPGLGNGVLQDILFAARIHPKQKVAALNETRMEDLYHAVVDTLSDMVRGDGRDTETDLYGQPGRYVTRMSRKTVGTPCPVCGARIEKAAYMGGSVYFCPVCQPLQAG